MKTIFNSRRHLYLARAAGLLIAIALFAGLAGCGGQPASSYDLAIASTAGGSVITPGEGTHTYSPGMSVGLVAEHEAGYRFVNWIGNVDTIADVGAATTTITMNGNYSITAVFARTYSLAVDSTAGGEVTLPGEGVFNYEADAVVDLVAEAAEGYYFVHWTGDVDTVADIEAAVTTIVMGGDYSITASFEEEESPYSPMVTAGRGHTAGLKSDGTVIAVGLDSEGQCDVGGWTDIVQIAAGFDHTVGIESDGTVVAVGLNDHGQCNIGDWAGIVQVSANRGHTVGLKSNGTVIAVGDNTLGQCDVTGWTDIVEIAAGYDHTVGLKSDGTVVAAGWNGYGQCNIGDWTDIVEIAAGRHHTVGRKANGTVVAIGRNEYGQCDIAGWEDIIQIATHRYHTAGLLSDGTVVAVGWNPYGQCDVTGWTDVVQIAAGDFHTVGLKSDGTVVAVGDHADGQCDVTGWNLTA